MVANTPLGGTKESHGFLREEAMEGLVQCETLAIDVDYSKDRPRLLPSVGVKISTGVLMTYSPSQGED